MLKKLDSVSALVAFAVLVVTASSAMAQASKTATQRA
jgi:hypothetical protein